MSELLEVAGAQSCCALVCDAEKGRSKTAPLSHYSTRSAYCGFCFESDEPRLIERKMRFDISVVVDAGQAETKELQKVGAVAIHVGQGI